MNEINKIIIKIYKIINIKLMNKLLQIVPISSYVTTFKHLYPALTNRNNNLIFEVLFSLFLQFSASEQDT